MTHTQEIRKHQIRCDVLGEIFREIRWRMETAETSLDTAKENNNEESMDECNARIEVLSELAKHIGKF